MNAVIICLKTFQHMPINSDSKLNQNTKFVITYGINYAIL